MTNAGLVDRISGLMMTTTLRQRHQAEGNEPDDENRPEPPASLAATRTCENWQVLDS